MRPIVVRYEARERVKGLMERCGVRKPWDLMDNALTFLERAIEEREKGRDIAVIDRKTRKICYVVTMPCLDFAAERAKAASETK
jgi:hypothetical protein